VKNYNKIARQAGMTLIELTVVLLVLVGLAGLMIPYVTGFVGKTHDATGSNNIQALSTAISRFEGEKGRYPKNMDSLILGAGGASGTLTNYTMADVMGMSQMMAYGFAPLDIAVADATAPAQTAVGVASAVCGSLLKAGITAVQDMDISTLTGFNATFNNSVAGSVAFGTLMPANTGCAGTIVEVTAGKVASAFSRTIDITSGGDFENKKFVAFGIGQESELVGRTMQEASVHFAKDADMNASQAYNRFIAIFAVDADATHNKSTANRAVYMGTAMAMGDLVGLQTELANYYTEASENN